MELCEEFLRAWEVAGYGAYKLARHHHLRVEWQKVTEKCRNLLQRSARASAPKGQDSEGHPYPWSDSSRT
eukprot:6944739-Pyramimonas_sp.AAC.1